MAGKTVEATLVALFAVAFAAASATRAQEVTKVPLTIDGERVQLVTITHKPPGPGPFPLLIFHHGSTGGGRNPETFGYVYDPAPLVRWFVARGYAVVLPQRRGRGGSEGLYDEGFAADRSKGYTCEAERSLAGAEHGLRDIDAVTEAILKQPFVDRSRFLVGGNSRGGILSIAWAGRHPDLPRGVLNFVGGWLGTWCTTASTVNQHLFTMGGAFHKPTLWLYGDRDPLYSIDHSRRNFERFEQAGGEGTFQVITEPAAENGHMIDGLDTLWSTAVDQYLGSLGLPNGR
jgi:pimeloyl-ACP methyl ester carboxylesterase